MADSSAHHLLISRLAEELGQPAAAGLVGKLMQAQVQPAAVVTLLTELADVSSKAARAAIEALPDLERRGALPHLLLWLDLAVALAGSSGAVALKYLKDSPLVLGVIDQAVHRDEVLQIGLELAEQDANVAMEFFRYAPQILPAVAAADLPGWLEVSVELTRVDVVTGLEYIRQIPRLAPVLPLAEIRPWLALGVKLVAPNTLGKPDYLATIEFLRTSPALLAEIESVAVRVKVLALAAALADRSTEAGIAWLTEASGLLLQLPSLDWRQKVVQYGLLLAERDAESALSYLRRCPEIVELIGEGAEAGTRFGNWFGAGMEVLDYSVEGARAYFGVASRQALASVEQALSGVPLRRVARRVKLFVEGLCGADLSIAPLPESPTGAPARAAVSADGRTIALPPLLRRYPTADANERLYLVMAAHEAGHLEFGTYRLRLDALSDLIHAVRARYGAMDRRTDSLAALFHCYPQPQLIRDLWTLLEDARIESLLQAAYPGLSGDLARLAAESMTERDPAAGLTVTELIVDCLLRLTTGGSEQSIPSAVKSEVAALWALCRPILGPSATAEDAVRVADEVYVRMEELLEPRVPPPETESSGPENRPVGAGRPSGAIGDYHPVTNLAHRGRMDPERITRDENGDELGVHEHEGPSGAAAHGGDTKEGDRAGQGYSAGRDERSPGEMLGAGRSLPSVTEELLSLDVDPVEALEQHGDGSKTIRYPEWDSTIRDYRPHWCRVTERAADSGSDECVSAALRTHHSAIKSLRRFFESLRPPALRRVPGQMDGEDLDLDAVVRRAADLRAGSEGGDRIYIRREKKERDVAVALLIDVSGSTGKQLESGRRVIDVEKESLVLLCEALESVGDQYALFAYSGEGRASVDVLTVKDFEERLGNTTAHRLGGLAPRRQNRDGAAIRHAAARLSAREAATRLLILLSDGRPLDGDYKDDYALEDTKKALEEARRQGVHPYCVTIDREADGYLRRMYGDVRYAVIDRTEALPTRLPRIYRQLTA